jgi:hypothetical protein
VSDDVELAGAAHPVPENLNPVQRALYQKLMSTTGLLLQSGFAVHDIVRMVKTAAQLQRGGKKE